MSGLSKKNYEFKMFNMKNKIREFEILSRSLSDKIIKLKLENDSLKKELECKKYIHRNEINIFEKKLENANVKLEIARNMIKNVL